MKNPLATLAESQDVKRRVVLTKLSPRRLFISFVLLLPVLLWLNWRRGREVARSRYRYFTLVVRKAPYENYTSNPLGYLGYLIDAGESRGGYRYYFWIYSDHQSVPLTSFTCGERSNDASFGTPVIRWSSRSQTTYDADHTRSETQTLQSRVSITFDGDDVVECRFEPNESASWKLN